MNQILSILRISLYLNQTICENTTYENKATWNLDDIQHRTEILSERSSEIYNI